MPTPRDSTVGQIIADFRYNPLLGREIWDGTRVSVIGILNDVFQIDSGFIAVLSSGIADDFEVVSCVSEDAVFNEVGESIQVHGTIEVTDEGLILLANCSADSVSSPYALSYVAHIMDEQPSIREINKACAILEGVGYERINDKILTSVETRRYVNVARRLGYTSDMVLAVAEIVIEVEGTGAQEWCAIFGSAK